MTVRHLAGLHPRVLWHISVLVLESSGKAAVRGGRPPGDREKTGWHWKRLDICSRPRLRTSFGGVFREIPFGDCSSIQPAPLVKMCAKSDRCQTKHFLIVPDSLVMEHPPSPKFFLRCEPHVLWHLCTLKLFQAHAGFITSFKAGAVFDTP